MEIHRIIFSPIEVNTYILWDRSGECAIIDCGCYDTDEFETLVSFVESRKLKPVLLLNTHCHLDHLFGNMFMLEKYNLGTFCSKAEEYNREDSVKHAVMFGLSMDVPPVPAGFLTEGQEVTFGESHLNVLDVPGHSKGSIAFYCRNDKALFTGDALFAGSIGRTDLAGGDYETLVKSIRTKLFTLPGDTVVYPGHGNRTTIKKEIESNPFFINS